MNLDRIIAVRNNKTVYRDNNRVIKLFAEDYSKADILNEALNQARIEETGLCIPKVLEVTTIDGKWAIISEYIKGVSLDRLMKENPQKESEYLDRFVALQMKIHALHSPLLSRQKDKMNFKICLADIDATTRYDLHTRLDAMPKHCKVCHGDFNPSNVIVKDDGSLCVLDWSHATQGNGAADAAITYLYFMQNGKETLAEKYLSLYCEKSKTTMDYLKSWLPIAAAAQSVKATPQHREYLLSVVANDE